jgi:hypothetical protein
MPEAEHLPIHLKEKIEERKDKYSLRMSTLFEHMNDWELFDFDTDSRMFMAIKDINENLIITSSTEITVDPNFDWSGDSAVTQNDKIKEGTNIWNFGGVTSFFLIPANIVVQSFLNLPGPGGQVTLYNR